MIATKVKKNNNLIDFSKPIICSVESYIPTEENKLRIIDEKNKIIETVLTILDVITRNRCYYGADEVLRSMKESRYIQENLAQGTWLGEKEHPPKGCDLKRFRTIDDTRVSHKIYKYWIENNNYLYGKVQFIPPWGDLIWEYLTKANMNIGHSLRIYTPNYIKKEDRDGPYVVKTYPMHPVTFDCIVGLTGLYKSRAMDPDIFASKNKDYLENMQAPIMSKEDLKEIEKKESFTYSIKNPSEQIKDILASYSNESAIIQDLFNFDLKEANAIYNSDSELVTLNGKGGRNISMHVNTYIFNEIMKK
jgi:hypothetical protein